MKGDLHFFAECKHIFTNLFHLSSWHFQIFCFVSFYRFACVVQGVPTSFRLVKISNLRSFKKIWKNWSNWMSTHFHEFFSPFEFRGILYFFRYYSLSKTCWYTRYNLVYLENVTLTTKFISLTFSRYFSRIFFSLCLLNKIRLKKKSAGRPLLKSRINPFA